RRGGDHDAAHHTHDHPHEHEHEDGHGQGHEHRPRQRLGLVGMGVAGGLVPSPSALVVLLGAIALGRTWFGVLLVVAYGLGMAATLTGAGLVLLRARRALDRRAGARPGPGPGLVARVAGALPVAT